MKNKFFAENQFIAMLNTVILIVVNLLLIQQRELLIVLQNVVSQKFKNLTSKVSCYCVYVRVEKCMCFKQKSFAIMSPKSYTPLPQASKWCIAQTNRTKITFHTFVHNRDTYTYPKSFSIHIIRRKKRIYSNYIITPTIMKTQHSGIFEKEVPFFDI